METYTIILRTPNNEHLTLVQQDTEPWAAYETACLVKNLDPLTCYFVAYMEGDFSTEISLPEFE